MRVTRRALLSGVAALAVLSQLPTPAVAGTITKTIGTTARDFSTVALWEASIPANLVTDGNSYVGQCFNDSEFSVASTVVTFSGFTTDSTHTITLTTGTGQSFRDTNTNALLYNQANGVGLKTTGGYNATVDVQSDFVTLSNLQITNTSGSGGPNSVYKNNAGSGGSHDNTSNCIFQQGSLGSAVIMKWGTHTNDVIIHNFTSGFGLDVEYPQSGSAFYGITLVRPTGVTGSLTAIQALSGSGFNPVFENCAIFGFATFSSGGATFACTTCMTDLASGLPSGVTGSKTFSSQFVGVATGAMNFRTKTGADLLNAGTTDSTNMPTDIYGTTRPQGSAVDIGAHELIVAGATVVPLPVPSTLAPFTHP